VLLKDGVEKHPAMLSRFADCIETLRKEQTTGTKLADEIGLGSSAAKGEAKMSILLVEQYLDFLQGTRRHLRDHGARRGRLCRQPVDALTDDVVKKYLTV